MGNRENRPRTVSDKPATMKASVLLASLLIVIACQYESVEAAKKMGLDELREMLKPMSKSCRGKTGVPEEMIAATKLGQFPRERPLMCYFKCLSVMIKVMNKQGVVTPKNVEAQIDMLVKEELAPRLKEIGRLCFDKVPTKEDACEYAFDLVVCGYNEDKTMYFLP